MDAGTLHCLVDKGIKDKEFGERQTLALAQGTRHKKRTTRIRFFYR